MREVQQGASGHLEQQGGQGPQHGIQGQGPGTGQDVEGQAVPLVDQASDEGLIDAKVLPIHVVEIEVDEFLDVGSRGQLADQRFVALAHVVALLGRDLGG